MMDEPARPTITATLDAPAEARRGESISLTLTAENSGAKRVDLFLTGRSPTLEAVLSTHDGREIAHLLEGVMVPAILSYRSLSPGESMTLSGVMVLGADITAGSYLLTASILTDDPDSMVEVTREIRILDQRLTDSSAG